MKRDRKRGYVLCRRVLMTSKGWENSVEATPARNPAMDSIREWESVMGMLRNMFVGKRKWGESWAEILEYARRMSW